MKIEEYKKLKRAVKERQREHDRAVGASNTLLKQLKERFGCKSLKEAEALYTKKQREEAEAELKYEDVFGRFRKKWKRALFL